MSSFGLTDADAWYERNKDKPYVYSDDPVIKAVQMLHPSLAGKCIAEIGCGDGRRLSWLKNNHDCYVNGVEPSKDAIRGANGLAIYHGWAHSPVFPLVTKHDIVIAGFFLYVTPPQSLFMAAVHLDQITCDGGHLIIHDFLPDEPYANVYEHNKELRSRKMDHAQLWLAHPAYRLVHRDVYGDGDDRTHVTILKKDISNGFPLRSS